MESIIGEWVRHERLSMLYPREEKSCRGKSGPIFFNHTAAGLADSGDLLLLS
jgi:hypothetical protein